MKKIIILGIILMVLLISIVTSELRTPTDDKIKTIIEFNKNTLNEESTNKIHSFYSSRIKEKPVSYITDGTIVIINFNNTNKRIITKKDRFDKLLINNSENNR